MLRLPIWLRFPLVRGDLSSLYPTRQKPRHLDTENKDENQVTGVT